jgi:hypothetical protein
MLKLEVYVPDTPAAPRLKLLEELRNLEDGATVVQGNGYWRDSDNVAHAERVHVISVIMTSYPAHMEVIKHLLKEYKRTAEQKCVLWTTTELTSHFLN